MIEPVRVLFTVRRRSLDRWALGAAVVLLLATQAAVAAPLTLPVTLNGKVQYETFGYPDAATNGQRWENFFAATLRGNGQIASNLTWQFEGRVVADDVNFTAGAYSLRNESRRRPYLSLITGMLDYRPTPSLRVSVGKQIVNWSIFDELQPANLMTTRDESDAFRRVELGVPGISVHYGGSGTFAELMVVPLAFTPARLPQGRWNIISSFVIIPGAPVAEVQDLPPVRLNETQAGARLVTHLGALEASVVGYVGRDTEAVFVPGPITVTGVVNGQPQFQAQIIDRYPRLRAGGVTASYPIGDRLLLRMEAVYFNSPDRFSDDFLHTVAGAEYALDDWRIVLNYMRDDQTIRLFFPLLLRTPAAPEEVTDKGERRFFQSFIFGEVRYDASGRFRGRLRGGYDAKGEFLLAQPEVSYRVWRTLHVTLLAEIITASRSSYTNNKISYFDTIRHEDRVGTRIEYDF